MSTNRGNFKESELKSTDEKEYVWYASYGSNMLYERFMYYIKGGYYEFNNKSYPGCKDKTLPKADKPVIIPYKMYFGNQSASWGNGGVSFLDLNTPGKSLGRMYLVTREQFDDIHDQEGKHKNWYNEICELGEFEGYKILTFTNKTRRAVCMPSDKYFDVVDAGIKETYPEMSSFEIMRYLVDCRNS
jgi:hypothetical protein